MQIRGQTSRHIEEFRDRLSIKNIYIRLKTENIRWYVGVPRLNFKTIRKRNSFIEYRDFQLKTMHI